MPTGFLENAPGECIRRLQKIARPEKAGFCPDPLLSCGELERLALIQSRASRTYFRLLEADRRLRARAKRKSKSMGAILADSLDAERRRIARELHTGVGQALAGIIVHAGIMESSRPDWPEPARKSFEHIVKLAHTALEQVRGVSRGMYVPAWQAQSLVDALRNLWNSSGICERFAGSLDLDAPSVEPSPEVRRALYLAAQEGISNVLQHANARHVRLTLREEDGRISLLVVDDGSAIGPPAELAQPAPPAGIGLRAIRDLARELGGEFQLCSGPRGATFSISFPVIS